MPRIRAASIDEHKVLVRGNLMDSAKRLIAEAGTAEIPLGEVALAAGVGRTTLYDYFSDRDDLIASIVAEELPGVLESIIESVPSDGILMPWQFQWEVLMLLYSPALTYMGVRGFEKWKSGGST